MNQQRPVEGVGEPYTLGENESAALRAEQVAQLYSFQPIGSLATLINAPVLVYVLWNVIPAGHLLVWLVALFIITAARGGLLFRYPPLGDGVRYRYRLIGSLLGSGGRFPVSGTLCYPSVF